MATTNPADIGDVTSRAFRTLTADETASATTLISDAWFLLLGSETYGDAIIAALATENEDGDPRTPDPVFVHNLKRLIGNAVLRVVRNPDGDLEVEGDDYRVRKDASISSGRLYFLPEELSQLFPDAGTGAFTVRPGFKRTLRPPLPEDAFYEPIGY